MMDRLRQELISITASIERAKLLGPPSWPLNEANTKRIVIEPLLRALGYDDFDYSKESYTVGAEFIDYLALPGTDQKWVLEVKDWEARLTERFERQAVNYANTSGAQWAVLTNGKTWWFYNTRAEGDLREQRIYDLPDIADTDRAVDMLSRLSRESVVGGRLEKEYRTRAICTALRAQLLAGNRRIVRVLESVIGPSLDKHISDADIMEAIKIIVPEQSTTDAVPQPEDQSAAQDECVPSIGAFVTLAELVRTPDLCTGAHPVCVSGLGIETTATSSWRDVVTFIVEHSPASALGLLPFAAGPRANRYFLNLEPKHANGQRMRAPRLISWAGAQVYAELHYSAERLLSITSCWLHNLGIDGSSVKLSLVGNDDELA